ncbi:hypothetical protein BCSJ1_26288, partial [Bacillus cereus SJ1]
MQPQHRPAQTAKARNAARPRLCTLEQEQNSGTRLRGRHGASRLGFGNRACVVRLLGNELCLVFRLARL